MFFFFFYMAFNLNGSDPFRKYSQLEAQLVTRIGRQIQFVLALQSWRHKASAQKVMPALKVFSTQLGRRQ